MFRLEAFAHADLKSAKKTVLSSLSFCAFGRVRAAHIMLVKIIPARVNHIRKTLNPQNVVILIRSIVET